MTQLPSNIHSIPIPLPDNPLKSLNAYLITGNGRNLLIDTGFRAQACREALAAGLKNAGVTMDNTDIFLTHLHSDHTGLAPELASENSNVYISAEDLARMTRSSKSGDWSASDSFFLSEGFPQHELDILATENPARSLAPHPFDGYTAIEDGKQLRCGGLELEAIATPGHTPGHMCLYCREKQIMFLGDHVLFDITPNITSWLGFENSLGRYIESLRKLKSYPVIFPLPAHRGISGSLSERIDGIILHHQNRLDEAFSIVKGRPGLTAYEITSHMTWQIRCRDWSGFPVPQKWFAVGEAISHLDYLLLEGMITKQMQSGVYMYSTI